MGICPSADGGSIHCRPSDKVNAGAKPAKARQPANELRACISSWAFMSFNFFQIFVCVIYLQ